MWNASKNDIPRTQIIMHNVNVLKKALQGVYEGEDPRTSDVYIALDILSDYKLYNQRGLLYFKKALEKESFSMLIEAYKYIERDYLFRKV